MTPPPATATASAPPRPPAAAGAVGPHVWSVEDGLSSGYQVAAVVVPPIVVALSALALMVLAAQVQRSLGVAGTATATVLLAIHMPVLAGLVTLLQGLGRSVLAGWLLLPMSAGLSGALALVLPGPEMPITILALASALSAAAQPIASMWSQCWAQGEESEATLVLSTGMNAAAVIERLNRISGLRISSLLVPGVLERRISTVVDIPVFSRVVPALSRDRKAIVSCPSRDPQVDAVVAQLVARGYSVMSESSVLRTAEGRIDPDLASPLNLLLSHPCGGRHEWVYRARDLALAVPALALLAPLFALMAIVIRLDSPGPAFYLQRRLGARGRAFRVIKFRTMRRDAEASTGPVWAVEKDPRITRVGRWLRRTRLDEFPQLINVALGQMSLVGPRPERAHFFRHLRSEIPMFELRTALRPGLTGWAQVRGTYASDVQEARVKLGRDLFYFSRRSLWFDLAILFETFTVAFSGRGAR